MPGGNNLPGLPQGTLSWGPQGCVTPPSTGNSGEHGKVGQGCPGERVKDQHGSVLERRESFLNREDRDHCFEQDLTPCYLEKKYFIQGRWVGQPWTTGVGQILHAKRAASHPHPYSSPRRRCQGESSSLERSRAARGQTIPCPEQDTRDSHVSEQPAQGRGFPCSQSLGATASG